MTQMSAGEIGGLMTKRLGTATEQVPDVSSVVPSDQFTTPGLSVAAAEQRAEP